jgi:hypothetical protein
MLFPDAENIDSYECRLGTDARKKWRGHHAASYRIVSSLDPEDFEALSISFLMAMACRIAPRHCLTRGSRSLNKAIRARARAAWNFVTVVVGKPSRAASSVHSPGTWNWASTGVALMSKAAATITDRIMSPMLRWTRVEGVMSDIGSQATASACRSIA